MKSTLAFFLFFTFLATNVQSNTPLTFMNDVLSENSQRATGSARIWFDPATKQLHFLINTDGQRERVYAKVGNKNGLVAQEIFTILEPTIQEFTIDLSNQTRGVYQVKAYSRTIVEYVKFVID